MAVIYLIRHEEPTLRGRFIGRTDPPLSETGAAAALAKFSRFDPDALIYTSPLQRAQQTAAVFDRPLVTIDEFAEIHFGDWENLTWPEIEARWPYVSSRKVADWIMTTPPNGEAWDDFRARVLRGLDRVLAGPRPAAIVAHMVVNAVLAERLLGRDPRTFVQQYGEILVCDA